MNVPAVAKQIVDAIFDRNGESGEETFIIRKLGTGSMMIGGLSRDEAYRLIVDILNQSA
jgi:hypothetical protein